MNEKQITTVYLSPEILEEMRIEQAQRKLRSLGDLIEDLWRAYNSAGQPEGEKPSIATEEAKKNAPSTEEAKEKIAEQRRQRYIALIPEILKDPGSYHPREILHAAEAVKEENPGSAIVLMALYKEREKEEA